MDGVTFLTSYIVLVFVIVMAEIVVLGNNKGQYLRESYNAIKFICYKSINESSIDDVDYLADEINRFYNEYVQEEPQIKKRFANVVVWMDAVIFRIDCGYKRAAILKDYIGILKRTRDVLEKRNPYNKCEKYQQEILGDMDKLKTPDNEILVRNVINRTEEEFLRLSIENKKNNKLNMISIAIGIMGIDGNGKKYMVWRKINVSPHKK